MQMKRKEGHILDQGQAAELGSFGHEVLVLAFTLLT